MQQERARLLESQTGRGVLVAAGVRQQLRLLVRSNQGLGVQRQGSVFRLRPLLACLVPSCHVFISKELQLSMNKEGRSGP